MTYKTSYSLSCVEQANYLALSVLDQIGLLDPTQKQIDIIESIILFAMQPRLIALKTFKKCFGSDAITQQILLDHLRKVK